MAATKKRKSQVKSKAKAKAAEPRCIVPKCGNVAHSRGLCINCRTYLKSRIANGEITEQQAIDNGLILPARRNGRPAIKNAMANALASIKRKA